LSADISIVDELTRAVDGMLASAKELRLDPKERERALASFSNHENLSITLESICQNLRRQARSV
jgi:phosphopantothenate synthetase